MQTLKEAKAAARAYSTGYTNALRGYVTDVIKYGPPAEKAKALKWWFAYFGTPYTH